MGETEIKDFKKPIHVHLNFHAIISARLNVFPGVLSSSQNVTLEISRCSGAVTAKRRSKTRDTYKIVVLLTEPVTNLIPLTCSRCRRHA